MLSPTEVVIINILVKLRLSHGMPHKVKRPVLLQPGGRVYCGERRKRIEVNNEGGSNQTYLAAYIASARSAFCHTISKLRLTPLKHDVNQNVSKISRRRLVNTKEDDKVPSFVRNTLSLKL